MIHIFLNYHCFRMAGADAVIFSIREGKVPLCQDGLPLEPLDYLSLLFPNEGPSVIGNNVCFVQKHFQVPLLKELLPDRTDIFTPDDFVDGIACFVLLCTIVTIMMVISKYIWEFLDPNFAAINPSHKRWYVIANLSKALLLAITALSHRYWIGAYRLYFHDQSQTLETKRCGVIYVATDAVALLIVPKLPKSTVIHHISTIILVGVITTINLDIKGWDGLIGMCKMAVLYAIFSTASYSVNAYLALRVVYPKATWLKWFVKISLFIYCLCCVCNWTIHGLWMINLLASLKISIWVILYLFALTTIIHDDIILIKWLINRNSPMASSQG